MMNSGIAITNRSAAAQRAADGRAAIGLSTRLRSGASPGPTLRRGQHGGTDAASEVAREARPARG